MVINNYSFENCEFEEFVEGSMINVFKYDNKVYLSTRSCLGGLCTFYTNKTFLEMFETIDGKPLKGIKSTAPGK